MSSSEVDAVRIAIEPDRLEQYNFSAGYRIGDLIVLSGQAAIDANGEIVGIDDFDAQAEQVFKNIRNLLEAAGSSLDQVVKVTIYLTDMSNFPKIVDLRARYFSRPWPADTTVGVTALAIPGLQIEIEVVALVRGRTIDNKAPE